MFPFDLSENILRVSKGNIWKKRAKVDDNMLEQYGRLQYEGDLPTTTQGN